MKTEFETPRIALSIISSLVKWKELLRLIFKLFDELVESWKKLRICERIFVSFNNFFHLFNGFMAKGVEVRVNYSLARFCLLGTKPTKYLL